MTELRELIATSFDLGSPIGELRPIQVGSYESWRLNSSRGSFLIKRLWRGSDPSWLADYEISMELERRALGAGIPTATPVEPVTPHFGWAARIDDHGVWRAYDWLDHTPVDAEDVDAQWIGGILSRLHTLYPTNDLPRSEWRWLGVHPPQQWRAWLAAARAADRPWVATVAARLDDIDAVTLRIRRLYAEATDHIISHRDVGPWNLLSTSEGLRLIDWDNAGPTTATVELGRVLLAFGADDPNRMRELIEAYRMAGGQVTGRPEDLFSWQLTQHLSQITERIKISVGDIDLEDDPEPVWMDASTIDRDIAEGASALRSTSDRLAETAARL